MNFEDFEIPKECEGTVYVCLDMRSGCVSLYHYDQEVLWKDDSARQYKTLASKKIKIKIPVQHIDIRGELVQGLEKQKANELAEHHMKMKRLQDQIDNLLAIEYQGKIK